MVTRSTPALRSQKDSVEKTSSKGNPDENPKKKSVRTRLCQYTDRAEHKLFKA